MSIKLGNLDISSFKVGSADCTIYLGNDLLYSGGSTPPSPTPDYSTVITENDGVYNITMWFRYDSSNVELVGLDTGTTQLPDNIYTDAGAFEFTKEEDVDTGDPFFYDSISTLESLAGGFDIQGGVSSFNIDANEIVEGGQTLIYFSISNMSGVDLSSLTDGDIVQLHLLFDVSQSETWVSLDTVTGCSQAVSKMKLEGSASDIMRFNKMYYGQTACINSSYYWSWDDITNYETDVDTYEIDFETEAGYAIYFTSGGGWPSRYPSLDTLKNDAQTRNVTISVVLAE